MRRSIKMDICLNDILTLEEKITLIEKHKKQLEKRRKFKKGEAIPNIETLLEQEFVNVFGVTRHIEFVKSLPLRLVLNQIKGKVLYYAIKKENLENE